MRKIIAIFAIVIITIISLFIYDNRGVFEYFSIVKSEAEQNNVPSALILAIIKVESNFKTSATSSKGAGGLMQIMPETASWISERVSVSESDSAEEINIKYGTWYFASYLLPKYDGDVQKALAAYNAGHGNVDKWEDGEILFPETQRYVKKVMFWNSIYKYFFRD